MCIKEMSVKYIFGAFVLAFAAWFSTCPSGALSVHICTLGLLK